MFYRQRQRTFIRILSDNNCTVGYLKNFDLYHDKALDISGAVFLEALSRQPQSLKDLSVKIAKHFTNADFHIIENDARELYTLLETEGLIVGGETIAELDRKDPPFSYSRPGQGYALTGAILTEKSGWALMVEKLGGPPRVLEIEVEITNRCNERCVHCYIPLDLRKKSPDCDIDAALFYKFLAQCHNVGMVGIAITGGEAMLHTHFIDFIKKAKEYDFAITIFSNLTALNDQIIAELSSPSVILVKVSLYSMMPEIHEAITGVPDSFKKTFEGIQKLVRHDIPVEINCPIMKQNQSTFLDVVKWGKEHNIEVRADYNIFAPFDHSNSNISHRLSLDELRAVIPLTLSSDPDYLDTLNGITRFHDLSNELICGVCSYTFCMTATGDIYPCTGWQDCILGNIAEKTLMDILKNSPKSKQLRSVHRKDFPKCLICEDIDFCRMCLMKNAVEDPNGDPLKISDYFCKMAALKHHIVKTAVEKVRK
jgi:radical SAM protein with 4Fe4S-binding SPASM domain